MRLRGLWPLEAISCCPLYPRKKAWDTASIRAKKKQPVTTMKNPFKKTIEKRPWLKFMSNRYVLILIFFFTWMLFLDNYSYLDQRVLNKQIDELEDNKKYYQDEIRKDERNIKHLKNPDQIEKYAREKYYMKKENEDIYIIEFENDSTAIKN